MSESDIVFSVFTKVWKDLTLVELAKRLSNIGYDGLEFPVRPGFWVEPDNIERDLPGAVTVFADHGLKIFSVAGTRDEQTIAACAENGIPMVRTMVPIEEDGYMATEARVQKEFDALVPILDKYGVKLGVQHHVGKFVCNAMGMLHLIEKYDPKHVGALWDAAHAGLNGEEPELGLDIVWPYLCQVNLKNAYWERTNGPEAECAEWKHHLTSGRHGLISWPRVVAELIRRHYAGVICMPMEYDDRSVENANRMAPIDLAYAKSLFV